MDEYIMLKNHETQLSCSKLKVTLTHVNRLFSFAYLYLCIFYIYIVHLACIAAAYTILRIINFRFGFKI